jgi:hypothetical protein
MAERKERNETSPRVAFYLLLAVSIFTSALSAQRVVVRSEPVGHLPENPEPMVKVLADPREIAKNMADASEGRRKLALSQLGGDYQLPNDIGRFTDIRLIYTILDESGDLKPLLIYTYNSIYTRALIFDKHDGDWWIVGDFSYSWHWNDEQAERFIELREIVSPGRKDIVVRTMSGGTGIVTEELSIYRVQGGRTYRVFRTESLSDYAAVGRPGVDSYTERRQLRYFVGDDADKPTIAEHFTKTAMLVSRTIPTRPIARSVTSNCRAYIWDTERFQFLLDKQTGSKTCVPVIGEIARP